MNPKGLEQLWKIQETSDYLQIKVNTLYAWRRRCYGPPARLCGKHLRYDPVEVQDWYRDQSTGVAA
jgi:hypothetical protein